jgi:hypothetical protein
LTIPTVGYPSHAKEALVMRKLSGCSYDTCPTIWEDGDTVVVRGATVNQETVDREPGEQVVRLPAAMVQEAAAQLARR